MDTVTIICDTIAVKLSGMTDLCQPCVKDSSHLWLEFGAILLICAAIVFVTCYGMAKYYKDKEAERTYQKDVRSTVSDSQPQNDNKSNKSPQEKEQEAEIKRQSRVSDLLKEICELSQDPGASKEIKGKYNDSNANKLLRLYIAIDEYNKTGKYNLKENDNEHEAQQS